MDKWIDLALAAGFDNAVPLDIATLSPRQEVRDMCRADSCRAYGKNWTCPPHCGSLEICEEKMKGFTRGLLLQTVGQLEKIIDTRGYRRTEQRHLLSFATLCDQMKAQFPDALCLGSGGCRICKECAFPEQCRFPDRAYGSMEGYGLFVTQVCRDHGLAYHHGEKTITYTACILF